MAETCFVDYSSLGGGTTFNFDNELTDAPAEEDEIDVLNDETFGGDDFGEEFDWEGQNEKFAEVLGSSISRHPNDSGFYTAEKAYKTQEEYMEESINQLVIDDDEGESDPAAVNRTKGRMIPRKQQNLDSLFGPSSPPSLLDTDYLVSPTGRNIWGSPVADKQQVKQKQVSNIQSLFDFAKSANVSHQESQVMQTHHYKPSPVVLPKAHTLQEIENSILNKPKVLTAEELERHLRGEPALSQVHNGHPPINTSQFSIPPPAVGTLPQVRPLSQQMPSGMSPAMVNMINGHGSPGTMGSPLMKGISMGSTPPYRNQASPMNRQSPATTGRGLSQPIGIPHPARGPGSPYNSPQAAYNSPQAAYNSPQAAYGSPHGPQYQSPQQNRFQQPVHDNQYNRNTNNSNVNNMNNKYHQSYVGRSPYQNKDRNNRDERDKTQGGYNNREHRYYRYPYNQKLGERSERPVVEKRGSKDEDEYAGLMTQKERDWIIKIQLIQLQTDNPYLDDFYYTTWCMKKKAKERERDSNADPKLVIPAMARIENKAYKPAQFEGSLGRLTTSSVHNPRQIIDLLAKSVSESAGTNKLKSTVGKELRKSRQLLMDIEKGYNCLLMVDDLEKKILALPEDMGKKLLEGRSYKIDILFHYLLCDGNSAAFLQYMKVRKGRSLTTRALPLLDKVQSVGIVSLICKNVQQLLKNDRPEERLGDLFYPCSKVIESCNLATIVMFVEDIQQEESQSTNRPIAIALQHKFGSSMLSSLLHRGEEIYETTSPVDLESSLQNEWCEFVQEFAKILATIPIESVMPPLQVHPDIENHLERLLNKRMMAVVEDNLRIFTHVKSSSSTS